MLVPANVGTPGGAPTDPLTTALFLTQLMNNLNVFTNTVATILNALEGYAFLVKPDGKLYIVGPLGTETLIANP